jgi:hypothetical protein
LRIVELADYVAGAVAAPKTARERLGVGRAEAPDRDVVGRVLQAAAA